MKGFLYLMIVYILGLSCFPCADTDLFVSEYQHEQQIASETKDYHHSETHKHDSSESHECNPLCICSCCGVQLLPSTLSLYTEEPSNRGYQKELFIENTSSIPNNDSRDIWLPPKLSLV